MKIHETVPADAVSRLHLWERRRVIAALLAGSAAACTGTRSLARKNTTETLPPEGTHTYSESIQVSLADVSGENFLTIRLCQFPEAGIAWIWAAILIGGEFFLVTDNAVPWSGAASVEPGATRASYVAGTGSTVLRFDRQGPLTAPAEGRMEFVSERETSMRAEVTFRPAEMFADLVPGRAEVFGQASARVMVRGEPFLFEGPGQWHEQQQTDPRFVIPFVYASLWGAGTFATFLETPEGSGGYTIAPGGVTAFTHAAFTPPASSRRVNMVETDGSRSDFTFLTRHRYSFQVYGKAWNGSFVRGEIGGVPVSGFINTWRYPGR